MRKTIASVLLSVFLTFTITENYIISHMEVRQGNNQNYIVTVFGNDFIYE